MAHCRFATARQRDTKDHGGEWRKAPIGVKGVIVPSEKGAWEDGVSNLLRMSTS